MQVNKQILFSAVLLSLSFNNIYALDQKNVPLVKNVLEAFKGQNINAIAKLVSYPLERDAPIPAINNEREFIQRFNDVFDQRLLQTIVHSDVQKDWDEVGWRGIMLGDGDVWLNHDGKITSVNYQSRKERIVSTRLNAKGRRSLHRSVAHYAKSILEWETKRFHIRVDDVGKGQLRYVAWPKGKSTSEAPDIVLHNGKIAIDGTGRNQRYIFKNGKFSYHLNVNVIGTSRLVSSGTLDVFKNNQSILSEVAMRVNEG
ncbi:MAG: hypothetical protein V3V19_06985 [Cocleimonas sp.]